MGISIGMGMAYGAPETNVVLICVIQGCMHDISYVLDVRVHSLDNGGAGAREGGRKNLFKGHKFCLMYKKLRNVRWDMILRAL